MFDFLLILTLLLFIFISMSNLTPTIFVFLSLGYSIVCWKLRSFINCVHKSSFRQYKKTMLITKEKGTLTLKSFVVSNPPLTLLNKGLKLVFKTKKSSMPKIKTLSIRLFFPLYTKNCCKTIERVLFF